MKADSRNEASDGMPQHERREAERAATIFRPVLIEVGATGCFCLVRNLSSTGLMGQVYTLFCEDMPVIVHFHSDYAVSGTLVWSKDGKIGIRFDEEIDVPATLAAIGGREIGGKINRAPRVSVQSAGQLTVGDRMQNVQVQNISQSGVQVIADLIWPGDEGLIRLDGLELRKVVARWKHADTVGLQFVRPFGFQELAEWVLQQQALEAAQTTALPGTAS